MSFQLPKPTSMRYEDLFTYIRNGQIKIPQFQRNFVWSKEKTSKLLDSILRGYPVGTFVLWKTRERLKSVREIGGAELPEPRQGETITYILDGQQRITSLFVVRMGLSITQNGKDQSYREIFIDLDSDLENDAELVLPEVEGTHKLISVHDLLSRGLTFFTENFDKKYHSIIEQYRQRFATYDFSIIELNDHSLDTACEVFTRINTTGQELTVFEIMVAKTYDPINDFDLSQKYTKLINNGGESEKDLEDANFDTIPASTILQCCSAVIKKQVRRRDILGLDKEAFINNWETVTDGVFNAVDWIRTYLRIPVSQLLPYNAILVPLSYFFVENCGNPPTLRQSKLLLQYFFHSALSSRFISGVEGKLAADLLKMDNILKENPIEYDDDIDISLERLTTRGFSAGDAVSKGILCILVYFEPKSFKSGSIVKIDNSWLKSRTSKNYHHFFPLAHLKKNGVESNRANSILNITIVDDYLNKREIRAKPPSEYMSYFSKDNSDIEETMKTHLIDDLDKFGVWEDDFELFLKMRGERIVAEIQMRLNPGL